MATAFNARVTNRALGQLRGLYRARHKELYVAELRKQEVPLTTTLRSRCFMKATWELRKEKPEMYKRLRESARIELS